MKTLNSLKKICNILDLHFEIFHEIETPYIIKIYPAIQIEDREGLVKAKLRLQTALDLVEVLEKFAFPI